MRKWLRGTALGMIGLASVTVSSVSATAETLTDALIAAYRNSNLLEQNRATLRAADEDVAVAVAALRPVVSYVITSGYAYSTSRRGQVKISETEGLSSSITLSADLTLIDFGRSQLAIDMKKESVLMTRQALIGVEQDVLFSAVQAYVDVKLAQEIVALRNNNVRVITQELRAARDRFEVGEITRTDVSMAEARLAAARSLLASAEGSLMIARESYKAATGAYPGRLAALPASPRIGKTLEEARLVAMRSHPSLRQAQHSVTLAEKQVALAEANMKPTIGLGASVGRSTSGVTGTDGNNASVGLTMRQTIYAGGSLSALYRKALAGKEGARASLRQTAVLIEQALGNAWAQLAVYNASIEASDRQIRAAQEAFDGVREEASLGARTTLDVLDAEQELLDARAARLEADASRYVAVYNILASMGLLTVEHLNLGIPTYDPEAYFNAVKNAPATSVQGKKLDRILEKIGK